MKIEPMSLENASRQAEAMAKEHHGIDVSGYTIGEMVDLINLLYVIRRAKVFKNYGLSGRA